MPEQRRFRAGCDEEPGGAGRGGDDAGPRQWPYHRPLPRGSRGLRDSPGAVQHQGHLPGGEHAGSPAEARDLAPRHQYPAEHVHIGVARRHDTALQQRHLRVPRRAG